MQSPTDELKNKTHVLKLNARVKFPNFEMKLFNKFKVQRKVGMKIDGNYLKAKMLGIYKNEKRH